MEHGIALRELHRPKSLRKTISAAWVGMAMLGAVASAALAQGDQLSKETRELARHISTLSSHTTQALRRDGNVQKHDETQAWAKQVLENRPLEPLNKDKFVPQIYPETLPTTPEDGPPPTEEEVKGMLKDYLKKDWPRNPKIQKLGMYAFDLPLVKEKIQNPSLRTALMGLGQTIAVDAIPFILFAQTPEGLPWVKEVKFDDQNIIRSPHTVALSLVDKATGQLSFIINKRYEAANPFLFTAVLAHEALHSDKSVPHSDESVVNYEEVIALALHTFIHLQQLSRHPELAELVSSDTEELTRRVNSNAFARINAGEGHRLGNFTNGGKPLFPGSPLTITTWLQQFEGFNFVPTPGNELLGAYLKRLQEKKTPQCSAEEFNETLLLCILENQRGLTPKKLVAAANALELDTQLPLEAHEVDSEAVGARTGAGLRIDWWEVTPNLEH